MSVLHTGVEGLQGGGVDVVVAYMVQQVYEGGVLLAVDGGELDGDIVHPLQRLAGEEVRGGVDALHVAPLALGDHGRQLVYVAY